MAPRARGVVLGRLWPVGIDRRLMWLLVLAALTIAIAALAIAGSQRPTGPGRIVFVRAGDVFLAELDGSGQTRIATGDGDGAKFGYLTAAWSPDMRHIAAVRDTGGEFLTPAVDLMTADGALVRTVALDAGCGPSLSWSPDSSEVAIATCPADVPRDAIEPVESGIRLLLVGLDASADREVGLPPEWKSVASANPEVWTRPDLWVRWSPDGRWIALPAIAPVVTWHMVAVDGSGTRRVDDLIDGLGDKVNSLDWSPDGRRLAFSGSWVGCTDEVCLGIVDSEGGPLTAAVEHPSAGDPNLHGKLFWPEFSPDGDRVAVLGLLIDFSSDPAVAETWTLYDYDVGTARFTELTSGIRSMILDPTGAAEPTGTVTGELVAAATVAWTPDGRGLLYLVREAGDSGASWTIRSIDAAGGESSVVVRGVQSFDIGSPD
jgi:Tol biopolymer transport system component